MCCNTLTNCFPFFTAQAGPYAYDPYGNGSDTQHLAEENEEMTSQLRDKVKALKSVRLNQVPPLKYCTLIVFVFRC